MMMIDELIQRHKEEKVEERKVAIAEAEKKSKAGLAQLRHEFAEWAGPVFEELEPHLSGVVVTDAAQVPTGEVALELRATSIALCPLTTGRGRTGKWRTTFENSVTVEFEVFVDFLLAARAHFDAWRKAEIQRLRQEYINASEANEQAAFLDLAEVSPADAEELRGYKESRVTEAAALARATDEAEQRYRAALTAWWPAHQEALAANRAVLDRWRALLNQPFEVVEIEVGIMATDDDGREEVGTRVEATLGRTVDGYWRVLRDGGVQEWAFAKVVGVRKPYTAPPRPRRAALKVVGDGELLEAPPDADVAALKAQIKSELIALPPCPRPDRMLDWSTVQRIEREVTPDDE